MPGIDTLSAATGRKRTHARTAWLAKPITAVPSTSLTMSPAPNATTNSIAKLAPPRGKHDDRTPMATLVLGPSQLPVDTCLPIQKIKIAWPRCEPTAKTPTSWSSLLLII